MASLQDKIGAMLVPRFVKDRQPVRRIALPPSSAEIQSVAVVPIPVVQGPRPAPIEASTWEPVSLDAKRLTPPHYGHDTSWFRGRFELLGTGTLRLVFALSDAHVIKVPRSEQGARANHYEASKYGEIKDRLEDRGVDIRPNCNLAICELVEINGIVVLRMERVRKVRFPNVKQHRWLKHVDRNQIGMALDGELVRFDYGG